MGLHFQGSMTLLSGCLDTCAPDFSSDPNHSKTPSIHPSSCLVSKQPPLAALIPFTLVCPQNSASHQAVPNSLLLSMPGVLSTYCFLLYPFNLTTWNLRFQMFAEDWLEEDALSVVWDRHSCRGTGHLPWRGSSIHHSPQPLFLQLLSLLSSAELL